MRTFQLHQKPRANPNPEKTFCLSCHYKDLNPADFNDIVSKFDERIKGWFFKPTRDLIKKDIGANNFFALIISSILIDLLSQYWYGIPNSDGRKYRDFLKVFMKSFKSKIKPPLRYYYWDKESIVWREKLIEDYSHAFYLIFRCGVLHNSMITEYGRISGKSILKKSIKLRSWKYKNKKGREIAVNPIILLRNLQTFFTLYITKLRDPKEVDLRKNFINKFEWDYGIKLVNS